MQAPLYESTLSQFPLLARGKVRDMYAVDADRLLIVTTDRLSAFDVVLEDPIPGKGKVLNQMTEFWLKKLHDIVPNHSLNCPLETVIQDRNDLAVLQGRSMVVKKLQPILVEAVVRGYLVGSGWKEYQQSQSVCGIALPAGMRLADKLPEPIFTPAAKAEVGAHDENIPFAQMEQMIGSALAQQIRTISLQLYAKAAEYAATKGIIIADTKFEFGLDQQGTLHLMDEVLTPDSSRFWPADAYTVGENPPSYDKQFVRDWLESQPWNKTAPAPKLPTDVIEKTALKYQEALQVLQANA